MMNNTPPEPPSRRLPTPRVTDLVWLGLLIGALWVTPDRLIARIDDIEVGDRLDGASPYRYREAVIDGHEFAFQTLVVATDTVSPPIVRATCSRLAPAAARSTARRIWIVGIALHSSAGFECGGTTASRDAPLNGVLAQRLGASLRAHETQLVFVDSTGRAAYSSATADVLEALQDLSPTRSAARPKN